MKRNCLLAITYSTMIIVLMGCKGTSGGEEKKEEPVQEDWHMTDELNARVELGPEEEETFRVAAHDGDLATVKALLNQGISRNAVDQEGHTALMFAAFNGHSEIVLSLLDAGAEIDLRDYMGRTALLYGATGPFPETVKILLDRGANPNVVDSDEHFSPLMHAAAEGNLEVVKVLIAYGADRSLKDVDGDDAASFALQSGHVQVVEYLKLAE
ncbi:MAG: ankyrin repeat domain-containing protein [Bacteroidota bacterium]|nr:ankyrin repeat domain-containing protein [Bacteroidota bacterium]